MIEQQWRLLSKHRPVSTREVLKVLLENRCVDSSFFDCDLKRLEQHLCISGMDEGAELMARNLVERRKIVLVGDYDCDGVTSVAQICLFLRDIGFTNYISVIPSRSEGYGMPERAVTENPDASLFVAVDCGTLDVKPVTLARSRGADCIVIDHHEVPEKGLAPASVLINPKQSSCPSVFKQFCASGLTLLFLARLRRALAGFFSLPRLGGKYLELAAVGTVADMVPLLGGNRILARNGIQSLNREPYGPLWHIISSAGLAGRPLNAGHLGFYVGPRINAAGRMADARLALDLLLAQENSEMQELAVSLDCLNAQRQKKEDVILSDIRERFSRADIDSRTIVLGDPEWPQGIVGIIASRVQQELQYGPVIIFSVDEKNGIARGSARSVAGFDIHAALQSCEDLLIKWGGHKMAAGMTVALDLMDRFAERFEAVARECDPDVFIPKPKVDLMLDLKLVNISLIDSLKGLEPHGLGNPAPTFAASARRSRILKLFGKEGNHARISFDEVAEGVYWRGGKFVKSENFTDGDAYDVVFQVEWDEFQRKPLLNIKGMGRFFS